MTVEQALRDAVINYNRILQTTPSYDVSITWFSYYGFDLEEVKKKLNGAIGCDAEGNDYVCQFADSNGCVMARFYECEKPSKKQLSAVSERYTRTEPEFYK